MRFPAPTSIIDRLYSTASTTPVYAALFTALVLMITACATHENTAASKDKETWLAQNFSTPPSGKRSSLTQMPAPTRFRQQILQGQVSNGMNLQDTFATLRMQPYGTQTPLAVYWCDATQVGACSTQCRQCEATLFGQHSIVFLKGMGNNLTVNDYYPKRFEDFRATVDAGAVKFADQIHRHEIVPGMPAGVVQMIINQEHYQTDYYCDTNSQSDSQSCLGRCNLCKIVITGRSSAQSIRSIFLETHNGQQTVTNIVTQ
jgi:hypothetical protein